MATITAQMVKELRDKTGAGMMDCKKALQENDGDVEKALDWLRQKGIAKAAKKVGRATSEGLVTVASANNGKSVAMAALCCETDFVARGEQFQTFAASVSQLVLDKAPADTAALEALLGDTLQSQIATVGENMTLGGCARFEVQDTGAIGIYIHANNKIGVLVEMTCGKADVAASEAVAALGKNVAMQIAAANPLAVDPSALDQAVVEREREVYRQKALEEGKPANIVEKIVEGAVKKFYKEACLLEQPYIRDDKKTITDVLRDAGKEAGDTINVVRFVRIHLGADAE